MSELDAEWEQRLAEAQSKARAAGRGDVADYLSLRATNDMARAAGIGWLLETFAAIAGEANRGGASITLARDEPHRFNVGASTMVGTRLTLRLGVRALIIEAGWPRTPRDGIVRGGGLASARIGHFGDREAGEVLLLVRSAESAPPKWFALETSGARTELFEDRLRRHVARLLHDK